jgi:hypothetical protein
MESNQIGYAEKKKTGFDRNLSFSVILLRSDICLLTSDIRLASFTGEYNITMLLSIISPNTNWNILFATLPLMW